MPLARLFAGSTTRRTFFWKPRKIGYRPGLRKFPNVRILLYGHYRIAYERRQDGNIYVLGVFHGALDLKRHLRRP